MSRPTADPHFFPTPAAWRRWLEQHHATATEIWVGYYRKGAGTPSLTWPESVDEALCFGWIDGIRKRIDDARYMNRFTPRKPRSNWSAVNIARVAALWVMSARQEATRQRRLATLIECSAQGRRIPLLTPTPRATTKRSPPAG